MLKKQNSIENKIISFIILFILLILIARDFYIKSEVKKLNKLTIAKFTLKKSLPKTTSFYFTYVVNGEKIVTANSGISYSISNSKSETKIIDNLKLNGFYLANFDANYPNVIIVDPTREITDTTAILSAGFSREDLKH